MNTLTRLITSSKDPESVSLFISSIATFAVLFGLDNTVITEGSGYLTNLIVGFAMAASAGTSIWGLIRKVKLGRWNAPTYDV